MQKAQLLENENEYLEFIEPFIDRGSEMIGQASKIHNKEAVSDTEVSNESSLL